MTEQAYTLGFAFDGAQRNVLLVEKKKPAWQAGKLNGIGGKIEPTVDVTLEDAMAREWDEECNRPGLAVVHPEWRWFGSILVDNGATVQLFKAVIPSVMLHARNGIANDVGEIISKHTVTDVMAGVVGSIPNVRWLIAMALDHEITHASIGMKAS